MKKCREKWVLKSQRTDRCVSSVLVWDNPVQEDRSAANKTTSTVLSARCSAWRRRSPSGQPLAEDTEAYAARAWPPRKEGVAHHCRNHMDERSLVLVPTDWAKRSVYGNTCQEDGLFSFTSSDSSILIRWRRRSLIRWWSRLAPLPVAGGAPWSRAFGAGWVRISLVRLSG